MKYLGLMVVLIMGLLFSGCSKQKNITPINIVNSEPYWIKDQNGCKRWNPNPIPNETITWTGKCINGYVDGYGTLKWYENGVTISTEVGIMKRGKAKDIVSFTKNSTERFKTLVEGNLKYIGGWKNNKLNGHGTLFENAKIIYNGNFKNDEYHGRGTTFYSNGNKEYVKEYVGEWKNGTKYGFGTYFYKNGKKYVGGWKNNKYHGKGVIYYENGDKKRVRYNNGKKYNPKTYSSSSGSSYNPIRTKYRTSKISRKEAKYKAVAACASVIGGCELASSQIKGAFKEHGLAQGCALIESKMQGKNYNIGDALKTALITSIDAGGSTLRKSDDLFSKIVGWGVALGTTVYKVKAFNECRETMEYRYLRGY